MQNNDLPASDQLIREYTSLAYDVAFRYKNMGVPLEDLQQESLLGLLAAAERYDPEKGAKFSTYATYWIKKYVIEALEREKKQSLNATSLDSGYDIVFQMAEYPKAIKSYNLSVPFDKEESRQPPKQPAYELPGELPEQERIVLTYSLFEKLTLQQIARLMQMTVERVKQLRGKALRRLGSISAKAIKAE